MATTTGDITLKLLVDKTSSKVVFAEAGKDFVDFLFGLLQMPLGSIMGLLWENSVAAESGSYSSVYESVKNLDPNYLQPNLDKSSLLRPQICPSPNTEIPPLLLNFTSKGKLENEFQRATQLNFVHCGSSGSSLFDSPSRSMTDTLFPSKQVGYVKASQTYMVTDNLMVKPMSTISTITILNTFNIKDVGSLEEKTVKINLKKGLELVKATFESKSVLTNVFLRNYIEV